MSMIKVENEFDWEVLLLFQIFVFVLMVVVVIVLSLIIILICIYLLRDSVKKVNIEEKYQVICELIRGWIFE